MAHITTARVTTSAAYTFTSLVVTGKGREVNKNKRHVNYVERYYSPVEAVLKGKVIITKRASGRGFSLREVGKGGRLVYVANGADLMVFTPGNVWGTTCTIEHLWDALGE